MWEAAFAGFRLGLGLILVIGAQNAYVLRQGILRQHVLAVCLFCALSDAVLIGVGVAGFGAAAEALPWLGEALRWGGVAFLVWYGWRSLRAALAGGGVLRADGNAGAAQGLLRTLGPLVALTWLNPHVWLDTVVLLGSVASGYGDARPAFAGGAILASFAFFFGLGFGARLLAPLLARPRAWALLDTGIALMMWSLAAGLALG
jgi:L-lysine exporter family protein LysE/ArgO